MQRYCTNCNQAFEVNIKSMKQLEHLRCPHCDAPVDANSRPPQTQDSEKTEETLGMAYLFWIRLSIVVFPICGAAGTALYFTGLYTPLRVITLVSLCMFLVIIVTRGALRLLWPAAGAALGFILIRTLEGACLGVMLAWIVRYLVWLVWTKILGGLIKLGQ